MSIIVVFAVVITCGWLALGEPPARRPTVRPTTDAVAMSGPSMTVSARRTALPRAGSTDVPFDVDSQVPVVEVRWGGAGPPHRFILDTGATMTNLIAPSPLATAVVPPSAEVVQVGSGDTARLPGRIVRGCSVGVGAATFEQFDALAIPYATALVGHFKRPIEGGLGWAMFRHTLLTVDPDRRRVTIADGQLPPPDGGDVLPLRLGENGSLEVSVTLAGRAVWVTPDTGAGSDDNLSLDDDAAAGLAWDRPPTTRSNWYIDGERVGRQGQVVGEMRIGRYVIEDPLVHAGPGVPRVLSGATLRHFRVTFDVRQMRMRLDGPVDAPPGTTHLRGENSYQAALERPRGPRRPRWFKVDAAAAAKGLSLRFDHGAAVLARPGRSLYFDRLGVLTEVSGTDYHARVDTIGSVTVGGTSFCDNRWYERSPHDGDAAPRVSMLNPYGTTLGRSTDPATGQTTITTPYGMTVVERPDGSTRTTLADGVVFDWPAGGVVAVRWPDPPATRPATTRSSTAVP